MGNILQCCKSNKTQESIQGDELDDVLPAGSNCTT